MKKQAILAVVLVLLVALGAPLGALAAYEVSSYAELAAAALANATAVKIMNSIQFGDGDAAVVFNKSVSITTDNGAQYTIARVAGTGGLIEMEANADPMKTNLFEAENLTFTGGDTAGEGGALKIWGDATLTDCTFTRNKADGHGGAVSVHGEATFKGETVFEGNEADGYGGGLYVYGTGTFEGDVTFDDNDSGISGGGAIIYGDAIFEKDATFTDNTAVSSGGGLRVMGEVTIDGEALFEGNEAGGAGGGLSVRAGGTVANATFKGNKAGTEGGAIYNWGGNAGGADLTIKDSVFILNKANDGGAVYSRNSEVIVDSENVFYGNTPAGVDGHGIVAGGVNTDDGEIVMAAGVGSYTDLQAAATKGDKAVVILDHIDFADGEGLVRFGNSVSIYTKDNSMQYEIRRVGGTGGLIEVGDVDNRYDFEAENLKFTGADKDGNGGALKIYGDARLTDCSFVGNKATMYGGAVYVAGDATFKGETEFVGNEADVDGGGLYNFGNTTFEGSALFDDNTAGGYGGGAVIVGTGTFEKDATFKDNDAKDGDGGGIDVEGDAKFKGNATFKNNTATGDGGGGYFAADATFEGEAEFVGNEAGMSGGGAFIVGNGTFEKDATFTDNHALDGDGGGLDVEGEAKFKGNATFTDNTATGNGGGGYFAADATFEGEAKFELNEADKYGGGATIWGTGTFEKDATFTDNHALDGDGGGIDVVGEAKFKGDATFTENTATGNGGGAFIFGNGTFEKDATFTDNHALGGDGGGIDVEGEAKFKGDATFTDNTATRYGGGVFFGDGGTVSNAAFEGNEAGEKGGAIYNWSDNGGTLTIEDTVFTNNTANMNGTSSDTGGAIHTNSDLIVEGDNTFTGNEPEGSQGNGIEAVSLSGGGMINGVPVTPVVPQPDPEPQGIPVVSEPEPEPVVVEIVRPKYRGITYSGKWCWQLFLGDASRDFRVFALAEDGGAAAKGEQRLFQAALSGGADGKIQLSLQLGKGLDGQAMIEMSVAVLKRLTKLEITTIALMNPVTEQADVYQTGELYELVKEIEGATHVWLTGTDGTVYTVDASGAATPVE